MVNVILAALISACLGFLAGSMFSSRNESPLSKKEAVTGDVESPAKAYQIPRPGSAKEDVKSSVPGSKGSSAETSSKLQYCEPGSTMQEQMARMKFPEMRRLCDDAEQLWLKANIDTRYEPAIAGDNPNGLKDMARTSTHWRGTSTISVAGRTLEIEAMLTIYKSKDAGANAGKILAQQQNNSNADDYCIVFEPYYVVSGKVQPPGAMSTCEWPFPKRGDAYYFRWPTYGDAEIAPAVSMFMYPFPPATAGLDYMVSVSGQWETAGDFRWQSSNETELQNIRNRYGKKLEQQAR